MTRRQQAFRVDATRNLIVKTPTNRRDGGSALGAVFHPGRGNNPSRPTRVKQTVDRLFHPNFCERPHCATPPAASIAINTRMSEQKLTRRDFFSRPTAPLTAPCRSVMYLVAGTTLPGKARILGTNSDTQMVLTFSDRVARGKTR